MTYDTRFLLPVMAQHDARDSPAALAKHAKHAQTRQCQTCQAYANTRAAQTAPTSGTTLRLTTIMATKDKSNKLAFLSMPAPASYVAGLGRG